MASISASTTVDVDTRRLTADISQVDPRDAIDRDREVEDVDLGANLEDMPVSGGVSRGGQGVVDEPDNQRAEASERHGAGSGRTVVVGESERIHSDRRSYPGY